MGSENPSGADNQQERLFFDLWLVGFADGEGCFSCPIFRNRSMSLGWQVQPAFVVVQGESSRERLGGDGFVLRLRDSLRQPRHDNHREDLVPLQGLPIWGSADVIVPFFQANPLQTSKRENFDKFAEIVALMGRRRHLSCRGSSRSRRSVRR